MTVDQLKVSVVAPVHNAGEHLEPLVDSLLRQSMPATEFEVIFVDDGSTDDTPARLDALAAAHPHIQVLHIENSGWPSRPRNLGTARARGEYVQFADDDDWFADEALDRLYAYAVEHDADIAIGKVTGHGRSVPRELFRVNRPHATLENAPLIDSLTCHKMFRRAFLLEHDLRFPDADRKRLEDHHMVTRAYLLARRVSVLSDYTCYHHVRRSDGGNLTAARLDPADYYGSLREVLDIIDAHTEPGALRDKLHRRWLRNEMVSRLRGARLRDAPPDWADQVVGEVQKTIRERFAPGVTAGLPSLQRTIAGLAAQGRAEDLRRLAEWEAGIRARVKLTEYEVSGSTLTVTFTGQLRVGDQPVTYAGSDGRHLLVVPVAEVPAELLDCTEELSRGKLDLIAQRVQVGDEFFLPVRFEVKRVTEPSGELRLVYHGTAAIDFHTLDDGRTQGDWVLKARVTGSGWAKNAKLPLAVSCAVDGGDPLVVDKRKKAVPRPAEKTGLWLRIRQAVRRGVAGRGTVGVS
ncbi:glycosyltransferase family 2 protein [Micromonospora craniellae]|uniref:Glycosyltransferase n=1 Tax=Micromonospora craniellae TaxID=2294034 RepID=A0A372G665_9ACTN|nr:glycosyltransferase [Micromonospora craniellae]QOC90408.1 glycosyltransferase [Micromonospora craniellae]RFS48200.1 glycosyltransferase [Micromonospora craniellae]